MARIARAVAPGLPHLVAQRGNRHKAVFLGEDDYRLYIELLSALCRERGVEVWAYCLMPDHVRLIAVPETQDGLGRAVGDAHRRYSRRINEREGWCGRLFRGRFGSCAMDEESLLAAARYVELTPVRAGLADEPRQWKWSSAAAHRRGRDDRLVKAGPLRERAGDWGAFLAAEPDDAQVEALLRHERTGRPLGSPAFVERIERLLGRPLRPRKRGRKGKGGRRGR